MTLPRQYGEVSLEPGAGMLLFGEKAPLSSRESNRGSKLHRTGRERKAGWREEVSGDMNMQAWKLV